MSVPVALADLPEQVLRFDLGPYIVTVAPDATPRATSVTVGWHGDMLIAGLGRRTSGNVRQNGSVTLLWPAPVTGDHALIVDGSAEVTETAAGEVVVLIRPLKAVLHVTR